VLKFHLYLPSFGRFLLSSCLSEMRISHFLLLFIALYSFPLTFLNLPFVRLGVNASRLCHALRVFL